MPNKWNYQNHPRRWFRWFRKTGRFWPKPFKLVSPKKWIVLETERKPKPVSCRERSPQFKVFRYRELLNGKNHKTKTCQMYVLISSDMQKCSLHRHPVSIVLLIYWINEMNHTCTSIDKMSPISLPEHKRMKPCVKHIRIRKYVTYAWHEILANV